MNWVPFGLALILDAIGMVIIVVGSRRVEEANRHVVRLATTMELAYQELAIGDTDRALAIIHGAMYEPASEGA